MDFNTAGQVNRRTVGAGPINVVVMSCRMLWSPPVPNDIHDNISLELCPPVRCYQTSLQQLKPAMLMSVLMLDSPHLEASPMSEVVSNCTCHASHQQNVPWQVC